MVSASFLLVQSSFIAKTVIKVHIISLHLKWIWLLMHKPNESYSHMMWHEHFLHNRIMIIDHSKNKIIVIESNKLASLPRLSKSKYNCTTLIVTFSMYNTFIFSLHNFNSPPPPGNKYKNIFNFKLQCYNWFLASLPQLSVYFKQCSHKQTWHTRRSHSVTTLCHYI